MFGTSVAIFSTLYTYAKSGKEVRQWRDYLCAIASTTPLHTRSHHLSQTYDFNWVVFHTLQFTRHMFVLHFNAFFSYVCHPHILYYYKFYCVGTL